MKQFLLYFLVYSKKKQQQVLEPISKSLLMPMKQRERIKNEKINTTSDKKTTAKKSARFWCKKQQVSDTHKHT
jgi:hypothetical protein